MILITLSFFVFTEKIDLSYIFQSTDYIHANFVDGYHGKNTYIGAQGMVHVLVYICYIRKQRTSCNKPAADL
jgi:hypothetical protein